MVATILVAAVAYVIRSLIHPATLSRSLVWIPVTITIAIFLSWPLGRAIARAFDPGEIRADITCPRCGRREVRPLIRTGSGLFHPVTGYRCAACWTILRDLGDRLIIAQGPLEAGPIDPSGIAYLSDSLEDDEIRFLDEKPGPDAR